jgi:hypothetical protein
MRIQARRCNAVILAQRITINDVVGACDAAVN